MPARTMFDPDLTVDDVMRFWPNTINVFVRHGMLCVGCPIGSFHTVADACREHSLDEEAFRRDIQMAIGQRRCG
jgi:hybrid cluster-associated redox disulfide protein